MRGKRQSHPRTLKQALALNPGLLEWSKEDGDLSSLRQEPDYLALFPG